jgi:hypothetical protein
VEKTQNYTAANSDVGNTIKQQLDTNRTYAYKYPLHCHAPNESSHQCSGFDYSDVVASGTGTSSATVSIPFNYTTDPKVTIDTPLPDKVVFPGEPVTIRSSVATNSRDNTTVSTSAYATKSKPSVYEVITFITTPTSNKPTLYDGTNSVTGTTNYGSTPSSGASCSYYTNPTTLTRECKVVERKVNQTFNAAGALTGTASLPDTLYSDSINVDDYPVGTKFCVALSVWPADSHNGTVTDTSNNGTAMNASSGGSWQHTPPQCFDIAKKPNLEVWGSSIFTTTDIITSQSNKLLGASWQSSALGNLLTGTNWRLFGSWSEYAIISKGSVDGMASGAAFGYELSNGGNYLSALPGGLPVGSPSVPSSCLYAKSTVTNKSCNSLGGANINFSPATDARLLARYSQTGGTTVSGTIVLGSGGLGGGKYTSTGDLTISASTIPKGQTIIINTTGNVTVSGNITYSTGAYTNISDLPQVLIFASNIFINESVTNIDAWLVAGRSGGEGIIDTCNGKSIGSMNANDCNQQLTINGPVFASKLRTNRTAGAGQGNNSITPGEVFNLRPDTYMWAYAQAQDFRQAVVTYQKSLPVRY